MSAISAVRRRVKVGTTLDPELVGAVDTYIAAHPGTDRSEVLDEALRLWCERQQELAMERQFSAPVSKQDVERSSWRRLRTAAARRTLLKRP